MVSNKTIPTEETLASKKKYMGTYIRKKDLKISTHTDSGITPEENLLLYLPEFGLLFVEQENSLNSASLKNILLLQLEAGKLYILTETGSYLVISNRSIFISLAFALKSKGFVMLKNNLIVNINQVDCLKIGEHSGRQIIRLKNKMEFDIPKSTFYQNYYITEKRYKSKRVPSKINAELKRLEQELSVIS